MTGNARSSGYEQQAQNWYKEPRRAVNALLDAELFSGVIYDPACGSGNISNACKDYGLPFVGSDIVDRGWPTTIVQDFLAPLSFVPAFDNIICNPPFDLAVEFTLRALELTLGKVAILQRTSWLEGERRYQKLFRLNHLSRVWQFRSRISMPPGDSDVEAKGGSVSFAWYVFEASYAGEPVLGWVP